MVTDPRVTLVPDDELSVSSLSLALVDVEIPVAIAFFINQQDEMRLDQGNIGDFYLALEQGHQFQTGAKSGHLDQRCTGHAGRI